MGLLELSYFHAIAAAVLFIGVVVGTIFIIRAAILADNGSSGGEPGTLPAPESRAVTRPESRAVTLPATTRPATTPGACGYSRLLASSITSLVPAYQWGVSVASTASPGHGCFVVSTNNGAGLVVILVDLATASILNQYTIADAQTQGPFGTCTDSLGNYYISCAKFSDIQNSGVYRLTSSLDLDTDFGNRGYKQNPIQSTGYVLGYITTVDSDEQVTISAGALDASGTAPLQNILAMRTDSEGAILYANEIIIPSPTSFTTTGAVSWFVTSAQYDVSTGKIVCGVVLLGDDIPYGMGLLAINPADGTLDTSFGTEGGYTMQLCDPNTQDLSATSYQDFNFVICSDGYIIGDAGTSQKTNDATGFDTACVWMSKLTKSGTFVNAWGTPGSPLGQACLTFPTNPPSGVTNLQFGTYLNVDAVTGMIYMAVEAAPAVTGQIGPAVVRFLGDGTPDTSYGDNGLLLMNLSNGTRPATNPGDSSGYTNVIAPLFVSASKLSFFTLLSSASGGGYFAFIYNQYCLF